MNRPLLLRPFLSAGLLLGACLPAAAQNLVPAFSGYVAIGTGSNGFVEVSGAGYSRQPITLGALQGGAAVSATSAGATFGPDTGSAWGTVTEVGLYDAQSGGNLIAWWTVNTPQTVNSGSTFSISSFSLTFTDLQATINRPFVMQIPSGTALGSASNGGVVTAGVTLTAASGAISAGPISSAGSSSTSGPSTYLGNIATDTAIPTEALAGANSFQTRSVHVSWDNVTSLALVIPNWLISANVEQAAGTPITVSSSIEYPVGTLTQVKWSGNATATLAGGATGVSDMTSVSIPKGAVFYVRLHVQYATGNYIAATVVGYTSINAFNTGTNIADQTMSGTVPYSSQYASNFFVPAAIIANTKIASVLLVGDSRLAGYADSAEQGLNDLGNVTKGIGRGVPYINAGVAGDIAGANSMTYRAGLAQYVTHVISEYGINNVRSNQTLAQLNAALATVYSYFPNKIIMQTTLDPNTLSSDNWLTVANQTAEPWESVREAFNAQLRTFGIPGANGPIIDTAYCVETASGGTTQSVSNGGFWKADGTTIGKYTGDGLHGYSVAYEAMAAGCVRPTVITR